jgi:hypothetical protein
VAAALRLCLKKGFSRCFQIWRHYFLSNVYQQPTLEFILKELGACKKLKKLDISDVISANYTLRADFFAALSGTALEELDLGESVFSKIPSNFFRSLKKLKVLSLDVSKIYAIERGAFEGLVNLDALYLDGSLTGFWS